MPTEAEKRLHRCCFSGHRPEKLDTAEEEIKAWLEEQIDAAIADGYRTFLCGMGMGVDLFAGEIVLAKRAKDPSLHLICVEPWPGFAARWGEPWKGIHDAMLESADFVKVISRHYFNGVFESRNNYLVDHSNRLIAYYNGAPGGTRSMIEYAVKRGLKEIVTNQPEWVESKEKISAIKAMNRYIAFDVETPNEKNNRMSAIGISVIEDRKIVDSFFSYVNPEQPFDRFNIELTGINEEKVADAPAFPELWEKIRPIMESGILVAHNARFDMGVLRSCLRDYGINWKPTEKAICTVLIGRDILPDISHRLNSMCDYYGIALHHHQADSDSRACAEILLRYIEGGTQVERYALDYKM